MHATDAQQNDSGNPTDVRKRFLLVGAERSGSTMLRLMLDHHPEMSCLFDSDFLVMFYPECADAPASRFARRLNAQWHFRRSGLVFPESADSYQQVIDDFFRQRAATFGKPIVGATIHRAFRFLPDLFPDASYIHLVRDGRPVAASVVEMGWSGNTYCAAGRWREAVEQIEHLHKSVAEDRWLEVRYEQLVGEPQHQSSQICEFLGVPFSDQMLRYHENTTYAPVDASIAGRWQDHMSARDIRRVEMAVGDTLDRWDYERIFPSAKMWAGQHLWLRLDDRVRRSMFNCRRYGTGLVAARKLCRMLGFENAALEARYRAIREAHIK